MKTLFEYEKDNGIIIHIVNTDSKEFSDQEFDDLKTIHGYHKFDFKSRKKWLESNNYELTRDNYTNESLLSAEEVEKINEENSSVD